MHLPTALLVYLLAIKASADLGFGPLRSSYRSGELMSIPYWMDHEYSDVKMQLVTLFDDPDGQQAWDTYEVIFSTGDVVAGNWTFGGYQLRDVVPAHRFAIFLSALDTPTPWTGGNTTGFAALSPAFEVEPRKRHCRAAVAHAVVAGTGLGVLLMGVLFHVVRRRRAARRARQAVVPALVGYRDESESVSGEKARAGEEGYW